ncbi:MAG: RecX family transcriptional regulator [Anaerolineae bacterium]|nr:RecX family transcriptional regulator [Anaerolineae bacterium]
MNIYLDGEFGFGLHSILAAHLSVGQELSYAEIERIKSDDEVEKAYLKALNFLSYRPRSESEVTRRMEKQETPKEIIGEVLERLKQNKYVDDRKFADLWVENRNEFRPRGAYALRMELRKKGVSDEAIEPAISNLDEEKLALHAARKTLKRYENLPHKEFQNKIYGYLSRRGFMYDVIKTTINALRSEVDADLESKEVLK